MLVKMRSTTGFILICVALHCLVGDVFGNVKFKVLHFNDFHARFEPDSEGHGYCFRWQAEKGRCHGGIARMKTVIDQEREDGMPLLLLDAGDDFVGTQWNTHYKGKATAHFMNQLGITAMTLGNHEFDWGPDKLLEFVKEVNFPVISSNLEANGHELGNFVKNYVTTYVDGVKIGICGPTTLYTNDGSKPHPAWMSDYLPAAKDCVLKLRTEEAVKIVILMTHVGFDGDRQLAREVPGVDLVIGGHTHAFLYSGTPPKLSKQDNTRDDAVGEYPVWVSSVVEAGRKVPVVTAKAFGRYMGRLVLDFDDEGNLQNLEGWPILMGDFDSEAPVAMNPDFESQVKEWKAW